MKKNSSLVSALALALALTVCGSAFAQSYPSRSTRLIVSFPPGGPADLLGRFIAQKLTESFGQQVVVDNRPGANSIIAAELTAKAAPDGYTLLMAIDGAMVMNPALYTKLPYDPQKDFTPISLLSRSPNIFVVQPSLPVQSVQQFIAYAKATPGTLNFGSGGRGTSSHLSGELLKSMAGLQLVHVPYKGATPAITDLIAGHIQLFIGNLPPILPQVQAGKLKALAVTSSKRWPELPNLPTMAESGLPGYETVAWFALLGPANLPPAIAQRLSTEAAAVMKTVDVRAALLKQGMEAIGSSAEELTAFIATDIARWKKVAADSSTKLD